MKKESFILVSLKEEGSKKLANSISNETCRKILNYLAETEKATETDISTTLGIPISTVHYNLQLLLENKLVDAEEFHYSKKGREILHYSLANKMIIIAPRVSEKFLDKLKSIVPVAIIMAVIGGLMRFFTQPASKVSEVAVSAPQAMMAKVAVDSSVAEASRMMVETAEMQEKAFATAKEVLTDTSSGIADQVQQEIANETTTQIISETIKIPFFNHSAVWWFLIGALITIILLLIWWSLRRNK